MIKVLLVGLFCFFAGALTGMYKAVELPDSKIIKIIAIIKGLVEVMV